MSDPHTSPPSSTPSSTSTFNFSDWDPDTALSSLAEETTVMDNGDPRQTAQRILLQGLPAVAAQLVHIALYGTSERLRLQASQTVLERTMGPANLAFLEQRSSQEDPLEVAISRILNTPAS
jgi:hypothetical protein